MLYIIITRLWNTKTYVVPVVKGALGMIPKNRKQHPKTIGATVKVELLQKALNQSGLTWNRKTAKESTRSFRLQATASLRDL